ncbi:hypothetical protein [Zhongshania arctica]|uniref:Uncharacterized protein n=1 Tax=Zhongshania arctica TaxID=3238302 RepID=A0ABV3TWL3_9GAMM|tara:strand:- start:14902 stop:15264 length:363 start_codon:yes stop_codon:yes gene_type:complete
MKLTKTLILLAGLGFFAGSAYADHRGGNQFEARYQYHDSGSHQGHDKHYKKHHKQDYDKYDRHYYQSYNNHHYDKHRYSKHHYNKQRYGKHYYARHEHNRRCGHRYQPAFNSRVKVVFGL